MQFTVRENVYEEFDMHRQIKRKATSPLGTWLLEFVQKNQFTLTELSRLASLSDSTLRNLIYYPDRLPSLETCVRLAKATGQPASTFLQLAGLSESPGINELNPDRAELLRLFDQLSPSLQRMLVMIAESLQKFNPQNPPNKPE